MENEQGNGTENGHCRNKKSLKRVNYPNRCEPAVFFLLILPLGTPPPAPARLDIDRRSNHELIVVDWQLEFKALDE